MSRSQDRRRQAVRFVLKRPNAAAQFSYFIARPSVQGPIMVENCVGNFVSDCKSAAPSLLLPNVIRKIQCVKGRPANVDCSRVRIILGCDTSEVLIFSN